MSFRKSKDGTLNRRQRFWSDQQTPPSTGAKGPAKVKPDQITLLRKLRLGRILFLLTAFSMFFGTAWAQNDLIFGRKDTFGIGPRAMGMGGAFVAVADDASAVYWNPAGLVQIPSYTIALSTAPVYFKSTVAGRPGFGKPYYGSIQFIFPIAKENTIGISLFRPFHPQVDLFSGDLTLDAGQRKEGSYLLNPSFQQNEILFTYSARFSAARNFSMGVNVKRITNDRYFIRYFGLDPNGIVAFENRIKVRGFGVDLGFMYKIPITKYSEELRVGLVLRDLVSRVQFTDGLQFSPLDPVSGAPVTYNYGPGFETEVPPEITLGAAFKNQILFKIRNITALDFSQISDPRFDSNHNKFIRIGSEFWFMHDVVGLRGGYSSPLSRPGNLHLGLSIRALGGNLQTDLAYLSPIKETAELQSGSAIGVEAKGINFEKFHIGMSYRFGQDAEIPPPKVSAVVQPASFAPSRGEKAEFQLDTTEDVTHDRWSVLIYDKNNQLVRALRGRGTPPTRVVWAGESDDYAPLPTGTYTWAFQVRDNLGHVGSTEVQTVEILGVGAPEVAKDPKRLYNLRQQQASLLAQESQRLASDARSALKKLLEGPETTPTPGVETVNAGVPDALNNTVGAASLPEAGSVPSLGLPNLAANQVLNAHFENNERNERVVAVSYRSNLTYVPYLYQEAAEVMKATVKTVGTGVPEISTRVYYGKNELTLRTPSGAAANYANGRITREQLIGLSEVKINGESVKPNAL